MLVEQVEVGLHPGRVGPRHPGVAVVGVAGGAVGAESANAQRQAQARRRPAPGPRVGGHGLETGIQQRGMHAVGVLLRADLAGERDLGQHGVGVSSPVWTAARPENAGPY